MGVEPDISEHQVGDGVYMDVAVIGVNVGIHAGGLKDIVLKSADGLVAVGVDTQGGVEQLLHVGVILEENIGASISVLADIPLPAYGHIGDVVVGDTDDVYIEGVGLVAIGLVQSVFVAEDFNLDADLGQVGLNDLAGGAVLVLVLCHQLDSGRRRDIRPRP